ncbi:SRPBCC domain-containing protein [Microbacterium sp. ASV81]|uniref:SRPBCC domain-containing protein n=1 Tax=Microbacterium capsulatum TaxID=3041921 RepID=A0ABU0XJY9_9MICO|nr:SRPBCC domain-containing protein [Microbacterium sp. ASV81]MDQ4215453.1 SRPBCC domain-containing protein [Microbacterium sp. ASV81]
MGRTDQVGMHVAATTVQVYAAFTDRAALECWLPPDGMTGRVTEFDPRPGGRYRMILTLTDPAATHGKSSADRDIVEGVFVEVVDGVRIVQDVMFPSGDPDYAGTMRITWAVEPAEGGSFVTVVAENVPSGIAAADHRTGITASLRNLAEYVAGRGDQPGP